MLRGQTKNHQETPYRGTVFGGYLLIKNKEAPSLSRIPTNFVVISGTPYYRIEIDSHQIIYSQCDESYQYFRVEELCGNVSPTKSVPINESEATQFFNDSIKNNFDRLPENFTESKYGTWLIIITDSKEKKMLVGEGLSAEVNKKVLDFAEEKLDMRCGIRPC